MFKKLGLLCLLFLGANLNGIGQHKRNYGENHCGYFDYNHQKYTICYDDNDLANTPSWEPEKSEPPVSRLAALDKSRAFLTKYVMDARLWQIDQIKLWRVGDKGKWVYEIVYECRNKICDKDYGSSFNVFLKMDGQLIEPIVSSK